MESCCAVLAKGVLYMKKNRPNLSVVGSLNVDLIADVETLPQPGQTISAHRFVTLPGGKGANQAVAAAKLGAQVSMYGCIGSDSYGQFILTSLSQAGVNAENVRTQEGNTGMALILVENSGENEIVVIPGANGQFTPNVFGQMDLHAIQKADVLMLQLEIPMETVFAAAQTAHAAGVPVILNPAPARELSIELLKNVDILIPNQNELENLTAKGYSLESLFSLGVQVVLETRGSDGVLIHTPTDTHHVPAIPVETVDTVGAGDTFVAAFAVAYSSGKELIYAVNYANQSAALSTTRKGVQSSFPTVEEMEKMGVSLLETETRDMTKNQSQINNLSLKSKEGGKDVQ
jgi:ribokinase